MKGRVIFIAVLMLAPFAAGSPGISPGWAQTYKWVDEGGAVHFTDDLGQVPERFRKALEKIENQVTNQELTGKGEVSGPEKIEAPKQDLLGRGEAYWKGRINEWREKIKALEERRETLRRRYNELVERYNESKSTAERASLRKEREQIKADMDRNKTELEEAKNMLEKKIPEEADLFKARREWLQ